MVQLVKKVIKLQVIVERTQFDKIKPTESTQILGSYSELGPGIVPNPAWWLGDVELIPEQFAGFASGMGLFRVSGYDSDAKT